MNSDTAMKTCYFCKGPVAPAHIDHMARVERQYVLVRHVPAEVCSQCGEVYLDANASRHIDEAIAHATNSPERLSVPVVTCA